MIKGERIRHFTVKIIHYSMKSSPCPKCGSDSPKNTEYTREAIAAGLESTVILNMKLSVHKCPKGCGYFGIRPPFIQKGYHYTKDAIEKCVKSVQHDKISIGQTVKRVSRDFNIHPAKSSIWRWIKKELEALAVNNDYERWVIESFSGVACIDEVYDNKFAVIFMTDPITDSVVGYMVKEGRITQEDIKKFLLAMRDKGINIRLLITDDSSLYADDILKETLPDTEHGLCNFHLIKNINEEVFKAIKKNVMR